MADRPYRVRRFGGQHNGFQRTLRSHAGDLETALYCEKTQDQQLTDCGCRQAVVSL